MGGYAHQWGGDEWQEYCDQLFCLRHPNSYARMPDADRGDLGIEGYSTDGTGCAYQCYASEAHEVQKRAEDQKRKIRLDLRKFVEREAEVRRHLGDVVIRRWVLVVPLHDSKEVTAYARAKEVEIRGKGLAFVAADFRIDIQTADTHFQAERAILEQAGAGLVRVSDVEVRPEDITRLAEEAPELTKTLLEKVDRLLAGHDAREKQGLCDYMQRAAVSGSNLENLLRIQHAAVYESYLRERAAEEVEVTFEVAMVHKKETGWVVDVRKRLEGRLRQNVKALGSVEASVLSTGAIADWLRRCPMDFPNP